MRKPVHTLILLLAIVVNNTTITSAESPDFSTAVGTVEKVENGTLSIRLVAAMPIMRPMVSVQSTVRPLVHDGRNVPLEIPRPRFVRYNYTFKKLVLKVTSTSKISLFAPKEVLEKTIVSQQLADLVAGQSITVTFSAVKDENVLLTAVIKTAIENMESRFKTDESRNEESKLKNVILNDVNHVDADFDYPIQHVE